MKRLSVLFVLVIAFGFIMLLLSSCEKEPDFSYVYVIEVMDISNPDYAWVDNPAGDTIIENRLYSFRTRTGNIDDYVNEYTVAPVPVTDYSLPGIPGVWNGEIYTLVRTYDSGDLVTDYLH